MTLSDQFIAVGIDVSKAFLDVAVRQESVRLTRFPNTPLGQNELSDLLTSVHCGLAVLEATGGYEAAAACLLQSHGHPVAVVNPRRVRAFAQSMGFLAKTDRADAVILAEFAAVLINKPDVHKFLLPVKDSSRKELEALMTRRNQLIVMHTAERQRLQLAPSCVQPSIHALLETIQRLLDENDTELQKLVEDRFRELDQLLQSIPGIGKATSRVLIGSLPELGHLADSRPCRSTIPPDVGPWFHGMSVQKMKRDNRLRLLSRKVSNGGSSEVVHAQDSGDIAAQV